MNTMPHHGLPPTPAGWPGSVGAEEEVSSRLVRAAGTVRGHLTRRILSNDGLTYTGYDVLRLIAAGRVVETRTLASVVGVSKATITAVTGQLRGRGLIRRQVPRRDRRRTVWAATPDGTALARHLRDLVAAEETRMLGRSPGPVSPAAVAVLRQLATTQSPSLAPPPHHPSTSAGHAGRGDTPTTAAGMRRPG